VALRQGEAVISIRRISLGGGYRYLIDSVAAGDGAAERTNSLARYYTESGTPPGVFLGSGLGDLDGGRGVEIGSSVTEHHLENMLAACADPISGQPVGTTPKAPRGGVPVAGFDLTFNPSKSVSVAWAMADEGTKTVIYDCHRRAIEFVLSYAEREVFRSRSGANGIVEEDVTGVVAAAFTHWSSRSDDPQLHDHVVVWNRAKSVSDGRWRTLDSRAIFKATVTLSELHQGVLSDLVTEALGVGWDGRSRRHSTRPRYEITGVPESLMAEFSQRAEQIDHWRTEQVAAFVAVHGRQPTAVEHIRIRQRGTLATRPGKTHRSLAELTEDWRQRADPHVCRAHQVAWVTGLKERNDLPLLRVDDLREPILTDAAQAVLAEVAERHATFGRMNLLAEAHRILNGVRFASPQDRVAVAERITSLATEESLSLAQPHLHHTPAFYLRADGSSRLRPESRAVYTTQALLDAEKRLLDAGRATAGSAVSIATVVAIMEGNLPGRAFGLSLDQALAVEKITTSGRVLDVLVGPAGTGKSTTMAGLRVAWETEHGAGSVIGLAPSAAAAEVLADELGIDTENTAKWLTEWRRIPELMANKARLAQRLGRHPHPVSAGAGRLRSAVAELDQAIESRRLHHGQLVIVDEASLAGTFALDELVAAARDAGAKVLLVGDWAQLSAVDAGGAFDLLVRDRGDLTAELSDVRRFHHEWEKAASIELRLGNQTAIDTYQAQGRITGGERTDLLDRLYQAWKADIEAGRSSLMIAGDAATVSELNRRARADRVAAGEVLAEGLRVSDGQTAGVGDLVVTRANNRLLATRKRWVKNGDRWTVTATSDDGSMTVRRANRPGEVVLPADYVAQHVELSYATTAHRAQGRTVDTAYAMVSPTTAREVLYVSATRGRHTNHLYVDTCYDPDPATGHDGMTQPQTARDVLAAVLAREGADLSAHETLRRVQHQAEDLTALANEYLTLAREAQQQRWDDLLARCELNEDNLEAVRSSDAYGPLMAALRDAEARGLDVEGTFPKLVTARTLYDAEDPAAVLHGRVDRWAAAAGSRRQVATNLIAGLVPRAVGISDPDMARALTERDQAMEQRARHLAEHAIDHRHVWVQRLGNPPANPAAREVWLGAVSTVAAYRDRWGIGNDHRPLGSENAVKTIEGIGHRNRAQAAAEAALRLSGGTHPAPRETLATVPEPTTERGIER
jgi:conjugative relaxase-like TrwC/TraI family protein